MLCYELTLDSITTEQSTRNTKVSIHFCAVCHPWVVIMPIKVKRMIAVSVVSRESQTEVEVWSDALA